MGRWGVTTGVVLLSATMIAGCSGESQPHTQTPPTSTPAPSSSSASVDPNAQPAIDAYLAFATAAVKAQASPQDFVDGKDPATDFRKVAFDPIRAEYTAYIMGLAREQAGFRGTPPQPRLKVRSVGLKAKPYPQVILLDCQTPAPTWEKYVIKTGKSVPAANGPVPPPYELTVTLIYLDGHWGPQKVTADRSRTCTAT